MSRLEILLVDDDPLIRHVIADELEEAGHFVTAAAGGEAALQILAQKQDLAGETDRENPQNSGSLDSPGKNMFDLVLVDYTMPGMSGSELVRQVLTRLPSMKMAILTGYAQLPAGEDTPPCPVITKGVRMSELIKAVEAAAAGRPLDLAYNATATRYDLLINHMTTEPVAGGVKSAMHEAYDSPSDDALPETMTSVLDRLPRK